MTFHDELWLIHTGNKSLVEYSVSYIASEPPDKIFTV